MAFIPMQLNMVVATNEPVRLTLFNRALAKTLSMPVLSMIPPNERAQMIRATVSIMLINPPLDNRSSTMATPVFET